MTQKKNIYLAQPTNFLSHSVYLPYSVGVLAAYAWQFQVVRDEYCLGDFLFFKEPAETVVKKLDAPFLIGFSCYLWNIAYNLKLAKSIKEKWPDCLVLFGGPEIPADATFLEQYSFVDILIMGEGEVPFASLLQSLAAGAPLSEVHNITYREKDRIVITEKKIAGDVSQFPSPYTLGYFDAIMQDPRFSDLQFDMIIETNRGCPFTCLYCSWGGSNAPVRQFPMEKIKGELLWAAQHRISFVLCADGNFGILDRDEEIADYIISLKKAYGYPEKFSIASAKGRDEVTFRINCKLDAMQLNKGACIAVQSLTPQVLQNIGRKNMSLQSFTAQLKRYREAGVVTYTEMILGLPGETADSFCDSLFSVIEAGQHSLIYVYHCELLPNAPMSNPAVLQKYAIKTICSRLNQNHSCIHEDDFYDARSEIVVETNTMSKGDWRKLIRIITSVQSLHCFGILRYFAIYCRQARNISYKNFYLTVYRFIEEESPYLKGMLDRVTGCVDVFLVGEGDLSFFDPRFGPIYYPFEEGLTLCLAADHRRFFEEIKPCLARICGEDAAFEDLFRFQIDALNLPDATAHEACFQYDWLAYYRNIYESLPHRPVKRENRLLFRPECYSDLEEYAREIVWYGKRSDKMIIAGIRYVE